MDFNVKRLHANTLDRAVTLYINKNTLCRAWFELVWRILDKNFKNRKFIFNISYFLLEKGIMIFLKNLLRLRSFSFKRQLKLPKLCQRRQTFAVACVF